MNDNPYESSATEQTAKKPSGFGCGCLAVAATLGMVLLSFLLFGYRSTQVATPIPPVVAPAPPDMAE